MPILTLALGLLAFAFIYFLQKKGQSFLVRVLVATVLGAALGLLLPGTTEYIGAIGQIYVNLLKALVVPLLLVSIIHTVISLEDFATLRSIGAKTITTLGVHNILGSLIAIIVASLLGVGKHAEVNIPAGTEAAEVPSVIETMVSFFPTNIIDDAANNRVIPIIVFAILVGLGVLLYKDKEKITPFTGFITAANEVMFSVISTVTKFTPYAVLALLTDKVGSMDLSSVGDLLLVLIAVFIASFFHSFISTPAMVAVMGRVNPWPFIKRYFPVFMLGFTTQSSTGAISANVEAQTKMGVPERIASFSASIGSVFGMPGCAAIWPVTIAVFTINALGLEVSFSFYAYMILMALLVSIGTVGVPGIATIVATAFFLGLDLPAEMVILMTPISAVADMARTATNVQAAGSTGIIVAELERDLDESQYVAE
ncbi:sodium:dicarboxylate symporter [Aerococcus urinaehominis]|uniref:L-cystine uptake protein TcyP n=1 Tax=Aerococcus urinaehominis TaxID=128944 RepID=A0A109RH58_9LACT|nr:dicarboxylate/amino acid:cation symporter [Aerococcus urinaehominis]AMB99984.1 sodium:dicarboxylate symporter [Aerococcus urinaehominis]SDM45687.1 hypothetical protein SAMN04487985_11736 [Aerococcus urinaehominis]